MADLRSFISNPALQKLVVEAGIDAEQHERVLEALRVASTAAQAAPSAAAAPGTSPAVVAASEDGDVGMHDVEAFAEVMAGWAGELDALAGIPSEKQVERARRVALAKAKLAAVGPLRRLR